MQRLTEWQTDFFPDIWVFPDETWITGQIQYLGPVIGALGLVAFAHAARLSLRNGMFSRGKRAANRTLNKMITAVASAGYLFTSVGIFELDGGILLLGLACILGGAMVMWEDHSRGPEWL